MIDRQPSDDLMMHSPAFENTSHETDPRTLMEIQKLWMDSGLEKWFQHELDAQIASTDPHSEAGQSAIHQVEMAKIAESPVTIAPNGYLMKQMSEDHYSYSFAFNRLALDGYKVSHTLGHVGGRIAMLPDGSAELRGTEPESSSVIRVDHELAQTMLRLAELDGMLYDHASPELEEFKTKTLASAAEFLGSIE